MRKVPVIALLCLCVHLFTVEVHAGVIFKEDFEGTKAISTYNEGNWISIPKFASSDWGGCKGISKDDSGIAHSGHQCAMFYGAQGNWQTSEMYTAGDFCGGYIWVSWWERLSPDYYIDTNHKWFLVQMQQNGGDYYTNFQCNNGGNANTAANMRIYSQPVDNLYGSIAKVLPADTWYQVKVYEKVNSPGVSDGEVGVWIKMPGQSTWQLWQYYSGVNIRGGSSNLIQTIRFGGTRSDYHSSGIKWIDDVIVGTTEADVEGSLSP